MSGPRIWQPAKGYWAFHCPGCECSHMVTDGWTFNGDLAKPTFSPSVLINARQTSPALIRCHSFVREGRIEFLSDCDHELAGQTVDLPEVDG